MYIYICIYICIYIYIYVYIYIYFDWKISKQVTLSFPTFWQVKVEVGVFENMAGSPNGNQCGYSSVINHPFLMVYPQTW